MAHAVCAGSDADSGVRAATLTLSPLSGGTAYVHTFDFAGECSYDSWNACAPAQTVSGFALNTDALANGAGHLKPLRNPSGVTNRVWYVCQSSGRRQYTGSCSSSSAADDAV